MKSNDLNCLYKAEASGDPFGKASASFRFMILDLLSAMRIRVSEILMWCNCEKKSESTDLAATDWVHLVSNSAIRLQSHWRSANIRL